MIQPWTKSDRPAAAATELAIALPFLVFVFLAALDFARIYFATQTIVNCAYTGGLYASGSAKIGPSNGSGPITQQDRIDAAVGAAAAEGASLNPPLDTARIQVSFNNGSATVSVTYDFPTLTPILSSSRIVTLTRSVTMKQLY